MLWGAPLCLFSFSWEYVRNKQKLILLPMWWIRAYTNMSKHSVSQKCNVLCCAFLLGFNDLSKWCANLSIFCHTENSMLRSLGKRCPLLIQQWQLVHGRSTSLYGRKLKIPVDFNEDVTNIGLIGFLVIRSLGHLFSLFCPKTFAVWGHFLCFRVWWVI